MSPVMSKVRFVGPDVHAETIAVAMAVSVCVPTTGDGHVT